MFVVIHVKLFCDRLMQGEQQKIEKAVRAAKELRESIPEVRKIQKRKLQKHAHKTYKMQK